MSNTHGYYLEDLTVGMSASISKTISDTDVQQFAAVTGDFNPIHVDDDFAANSSFGKRIVHGMFNAGLISAVLGMKLPGPGATFVGQNLKFRNPVFIGDTVDTEVTVESINPRHGFVKLTTTCRVEGKIVATGEATTVVDKRPQA